jgi:hypothetical protein
MLIDGEELAQLKRHTWLMAEAFGLDSRIERYQGKRPIGFYRWDMDCLIDGGREGQVLRFATPMPFAHQQNGRI